MPILTIEELQKVIPDFEWESGHSGMVLTDDQADRLDTLWENFLEKYEELFAKASEDEENDWIYMED